MRAGRALRGGLLLAALTLVASGAPAVGWAEVGPSARSIAVARDGGCTTADTDGVTVVVDFAGLGGSVLVRCATGLSAASRGADALAAAGISWSAVSSQPGFVCRINGRPSADETIATGSDPEYHEACLNTPPTDAYWSYWKSSGSGSWEYSSSGIGSGRVKLGGFEGWSFSSGSQVAPGFDPVTQPAPEPPAPEPPAPEAPAPEPRAAEEPVPDPPPADPPAATPAPQATPTARASTSAAADPAVAAPELTSVAESSVATPTEQSIIIESSSAVVPSSSAGTPESSTSSDSVSSAEVATAAAPAESTDNTGAFLAATGGVLLIGGLGIAAVVISRRRRNE